MSIIRITKIFGGQYWGHLIHGTTMQAPYAGPLLEKIPVKGGVWVVHESGTTIIPQTLDPELSLGWVTSCN